MKKLLFAIFMISTLVGCRTDKKETKKDKAPSQLSTYFENSGLPAAIMGYIKKDGTTEWKTFGPAIWGGTDTISENNIFRIYSMTKAITSIAALQLVEKGLIGLDDPLNELMPEMINVPLITEDGELEKSNRPITLRHLLTHTSGFGYNHFSKRLNKYNTSNFEISGMRRLFEPGEKWQYGVSLDWIGWVIEKISGQNLEDYIRKNIAEPLQMSSAWFNLPEELAIKIVSQGIRDSTAITELPRIPKDVEQVYFGGHGLYSSPKDYAKFLNCILNDGKYENGQILKPETIAMLFHNQLPNNITLSYDIPENHPLVSKSGDFADNNDTHSFAWAIENNDNELVRPKGVGYWAGFMNSYFTIDKKNGLAIIYFTQILPFNDKESFDFFRLYEKEVYTEINKK